MKEVVKIETEIEIGKTKELEFEIDYNLDPDVVTVNFGGKVLGQINKAELLDAAKTILEWWQMEDFGV